MAIPFGVRWRAFVSSLVCSAAMYSWRTLTRATGKSAGSARNEVPTASQAHPILSWVVSWLGWRMTHATARRWSAKDRGALAWQAAGSASGELDSAGFAGRGHEAPEFEESRRLDIGCATIPAARRWWDRATAVPASNGVRSSKHRRGLPRCGFRPSRRRAGSGGGRGRVASD